MDEKRNHENSGNSPENRAEDKILKAMGIEREILQEDLENDLLQDPEPRDETEDWESEDPVLSSQEPSYSEWNDEEPIQKPKRRGLKGIALFLVAVLIFSTGYGLGSGIANFSASRNAPAYELPPSGAQPQKTVVVDRDPNLVVNIVDRVGPSIVAIQTEVVGVDFFGRAQLGQSAGSGVIFDRKEDGLLLLTNHHVIDGARSIQVTFKDGAIVPAELLGSDPETDLAVLKLNRSDFNDPTKFDQIEPVPLGNSAEVRTGEIAIAIGNPLGLGNSVTQGIISSQQREIDTGNGQTVSLIQTDAAINPGNSGGALLNGKGELIGINTIKIADEQVEGIGFAIPINNAIPILEQLVENGEVLRPYLGIIGETLGTERAGAWGVPEGVLLVRVLMGTPARDAGLKAGDIITEFDGVRIATMDELLGQLYFKQVGDLVEVKGNRDGENFTVTIELAQRADE